MKVIKYGNPKLKKEKYFKCPKCEAVWTAHQGEYIYNHPVKDIYYTIDGTKEGYICNCPMEWCTGRGQELTEEEDIDEVIRTSGYN